MKTLQDDVADKELEAQRLNDESSPEDMIIPEPILKEYDSHSNEYVERLKDEKQVAAIIDKVQEYLERQSNELCRVYLRKIEHLYYKFDPNVLKQKEGEIGPEVVNGKWKLCKYVYAIRQLNPFGSSGG